MSGTYIRICPGCKEKFDIRTGYKKSTTRYWHPSCYEKKQEELASTKERDLGRQAVFNYLTEIGMEPNYIRWAQQLGKFRREGYTDAGILLTLKYWFEVRQEDIDKANGGMGIVPYVYQDAQRYFHKLLQKQEQLEEEVKRFANEDKQVIKLTRQKNLKNKNIINFENI